MNSRIKKISGTVTEVGAHNVEARSGGAQVTVYSFFTIAQDNGDLVRINQVLTNAETDYEVEVGNRATFYIRNLKKWPKSANILAATESSRGFNFNNAPGIAEIVGAALIVTMASPFVYGLFGYTSTALILSPFTDNMTVVLCLALWPIVLAYYHLVFLPIRVRMDTSALKLQLSKRGNSAEMPVAAKVTNI